MECNLKSSPLPPSHLEKFSDKFSVKNIDSSKVFFPWKYFFQEELIGANLSDQLHIYFIWYSSSVFGTAFKIKLMVTSIRVNFPQATFWSRGSPWVLFDFQIFSNLVLFYLTSCALQSSFASQTQAWQNLSKSRLQKVAADTQRPTKMKKKRQIDTPVVCRFEKEIIILPKWSLTHTVQIVLVDPWFNIYWQFCSKSEKWLPCLVFISAL